MTSGYDLLASGAFRKSVAALTAELRAAPSSGGRFNRALAYMNLGEYARALEDLRRADTESGRRSDGHLIMAGVCEWLCGRPSESLEHWFSALDRPYSDAAGGVEAAALLFYAGSRLAREDTFVKAARLLQRRCRSKRRVSWPGPVAGFLLGKVSEAQLLQAAKSDELILEDRQFCQAHFWIGVEALHRSETAQALDHFRWSRKSRMGFLEEEYYLAKGELDGSGP